MKPIWSGIQEIGQRKLIGKEWTGEFGDLSIRNECLNEEDDLTKVRSADLKSLTKRYWSDDNEKIHFNDSKIKKNDEADNT